ncbi:MAG TPA: penicillin-binding transpeptidase domain-containing protein [Armatimonadota bacterium]
MRRRTSSSEHRTGTRIKMLLCYLIAAYVILLGRLAWIQIVRAPFYHEKAQALTVRKITLHARRGTIYDRDLNKLAVTVDAYNISAQPVKIEDKAAASRKIAPILHMDEKELLADLNTGRKFLYLSRRVEAEVGEAIKQAKIPGIGAELTAKRLYPGGDLACHILGFTDIDGKGREGLEKVYDKELSGQDGYMVVEVDVRGNPIPGSKKKQINPVDGKDIVLTIDSTIQHKLESDLRATYESHNAAGASALVMQPETGEILALANMPTFDPNKPGKAKPEQRRNRAIMDLYEPGSTLKALTACAGVESKAISLTDTWYCHGSIRIGKRTVRCSLHGREFAHGHGVCNVGKMLKYSCNIAASGIGSRIGKERLYDFESAFGMYERPGSGLPGEVRGWHDSWKDWSDIRLANVAFGQGIAVTPLQMARAYSAVANGGLLLRPYIVKEILKGGKQEAMFHRHISRRVISEETSALVSQMLTGVVSEGTGQNAQVEGYKVAGKTGSAQKAVGGRYVPGKIVASFAGFLPVSRPKAVILVAVDEPKGSHFGAVVAAPVFQSTAKTTMWRLKIPPDDLPVPPVSGDAKGRDADPVQRGRAPETPATEHLGLGG